MQNFSMIKGLNRVNNLYFKSILFFSIFFPTSLALAANATPKTISEVFYAFAVGNLAGLIPTLIMIAFVTFLVGVAMYARAGENEEMKAKGRSIMVYGIIVLFVMSTVWGFVRIISRSFIGEEFEIPNRLPPLL